MELYHLAIGLKYMDVRQGKGFTSIMSIASLENYYYFRDRTASQQISLKVLQ